MPTSEQEQLNLDEYKYGFKDPENYVYKPQKGLNPEIIRTMSQMKKEPEWMLKFRLKAYDMFLKRPMPNWGGFLGDLDLANIYYYIKPAEKESRSWDDVPDDIKKTFDRLGIPEAERKFLAGVGAQYESEMVYHSIIEELEQKGVIFISSDDGLKKHPELFKKYFGTVVPIGDNKFSAINSVAWSGGSFVYVPPGVKVEMPLQAYFRLNSENSGQFERTLIIADEGSEVNYVEGCTAPTYSSDSFHSGVIEIIVKKGARVRYTTIQNWSNNVYNLVTQRALVEEDATMEWVDANIGSKLTMKYPSCYLVGKGARGDILSLAFAGKNQHQDAGGKMIHAAPHTSSTIVSKSISKNGGRSSYRGQVKVHPGCKGVKSSVVCDALLMDDYSRSDTYPYIEVDEPNSSIGHEATVSKVNEEQVFYLMSRGLSEDEATGMIVKGFIEPMIKQLPMEYAIELNRLIELEMEGSIG